MTDNESGYDPSMEDAGITEESFSQSPVWAKERFAKLTRQREDARREADEYKSRLASVEGRLDAVEHRPERQEPREEPQGLARLKSEGEVKAAIKKLDDLRWKAARGDDEAEQALKGIDDPSGLYADLQERLADIKVDSRLGQYSQEQERRFQVQAGQAALTTKLVRKHGMEAVDPNSAISKAAAKTLQTWIDSGDITAENAGQEFILVRAYEEAQRSLKDGRGGRGQDPRHSAIESGADSRGAPHDDEIAALKRRRAQGDYEAGRKAGKLQINQFLDALRQQGHIAS